MFNLAEWAVGVAPTAGPAHVLLAVLSGETVRVVEADLDADPGLRRPGPGLGDAALPQGAVGVCPALLETHVPHTGVVSNTDRAAGAGVGRRAAQRGPHTPVLGVRGPVAGDP